MKLMPMVMFIRIEVTSQVLVNLFSFIAMIFIYLKIKHLSIIQYYFIIKQIGIKMEESEKIIQLKQLTNIELLEQFSKMIINQPVQSVIFQIKFKKKLPDGKRKQKNLQEKTYDLLNSTKTRLIQNQFLEKLKLSHQDNIHEDSFEDQIDRLYELNQYQTVIQQCLPKQKVITKQLQNINVFESEQSKQKIKKQYNRITFLIGNSYFRLKNYDKALQFYLKMKDDQLTRQRAQRMNNLGTCYAVKKLYQKALKSYNQAIKYYNFSPEENTSNLLNNIAMIYMKSQMYKTAEEYFESSISERKLKQSNNKLMLYNSHFNLGICQKKLKKYDLSINNLLIALNYTIKGVGNKIEALHQICRLYEDQEKWADALLYYEKLSDQYDITGKPQGQIYQKVSIINEKQGNVILSQKYKKMALKVYEEQTQKKYSELSQRMANTNK